MKYQKILLAYNGSQEGKRALLECAEFTPRPTCLLLQACRPASS